MFRRHIANRLNIGRYLGIDLYIHWSFWLLMLGVGASSMFAAGEQTDAGWVAGWQTQQGWLAAGTSMAQIAVLFLCVTLHEYGHAMMARRFGVQTVDITLLPIGGVARLERMPRKPIQEFLVAVAGPAVNVVIAALTAVALFFVFRAEDVASFDEALVIIGEHPLGWLLLINLALVIFNMVPAFPMDGGRVFRSFLAMLTDYGTATYLASRIGFVIALLMAGLGIYFQMYTVILVSGFIAYAGSVEARQVALGEAMRGMRVEHWLEPATQSVGAMDRVQDLVDSFAITGNPSLPVCGVEGYFLGMLDRAAVVEAAEQDDWDRIATDLMRDDEPIFQAPGNLEPQLAGFQTPPSGPVPVVDASGRLVGIIRLERVLSHVVALRGNRKLAKQAAAETPIEAALIQRSPAVERLAQQSRRDFSG
ncbi:site-2 protease family protein [Planctomycetaceae bacterium SH139]